MSALSSRAFVPEIGQSRHRRVLFICPIDPSFGRVGEYIRIRNLLSTIGAFADVTLICPCQGNARFQVSVSRRVSIVLPLNRTYGLRHTVRALFIPYREILESIIAEMRSCEDLPIVWFDYMYWGHYAAALRGQFANASLVVGMHNVQPEITRAMANGPLTPLWHLKALLEAAHERIFLRHFDRIVVVSERDGRCYHDRLEGERIVVIPNFTDDQFVPENEAERSLLFSGNFAARQNFEGACWLLEKVWPMVSTRHVDWNLLIVGKAADRLRTRAGANVRIYSDVPDMEPFLRRCPICVVPILSGSGTRLKVIEALRSKKGLVSTSKGVEGMGLRCGEECLVADNESDFADCIDRLITDSNSLRMISSAGRKRFEAQFSSSAVSDRLESLLQSLARDALAAPPV